MHMYNYLSMVYLYMYICTYVHMIVNICRGTSTFSCTLAFIYNLDFYNISIARGSVTLISF